MTIHIQIPIPFEKYLLYTFFAIEELLYVDLTFSHDGVSGAFSAYPPHPGPIFLRAEMV